MQMLKKLESVLAVLTITALLAPSVALAAPAKAAPNTSPNTTVLFGGIHRGAMLEGTIGWPYFPRASLHYGVSDMISVGGTFALSGGSAGFGYFGLLFAVPVRFSFINTEKMSFGLRFEPGLLLGFNAFGAGIGFSVPIGGNFGVRIPLNTNNMSLVVGGGIDIPTSIFISGGFSGAAIPIMVGPAAELRVAKNITIPAEIKLGPTISTFSLGPFTNSVWLAYRFLVGVTYAF